MEFFDLSASMQVPAAPARARGTPPRPEHRFFVLLPGATGNEETGARAAVQGVSSSSEDEGSDRPCYHKTLVKDEIDSLVAKIKSRNQAPMCELCWLETFERKTSSGSSREDSHKQQLEKPRALIMVCLECQRCLCAGVGVAICDSNPCGHAWSHANKKGHQVALWFDQPDEAYCFRCDGSFFWNQSDGLNQSDRENGPDTDQPCYVVRGIPNFGNTCYVNALVQCLLALDKLRLWMLGPNAPTRSLGGALKELFVQTTPGNDVGVELNPKKLLDSLAALNARYLGTDMQDSQELLLDIHNGLSDEEKLQWPPKLRDRFRTVVGSIFLGQISSTLTCKGCLYDSPSLDSFSELSLTLPSKEQTTKSVDSPQRSLAIDESKLIKFQTDAMDIDKASELLETDSTKAEQVWQRENDRLAQKSACVGDLLSQQKNLVEAKENTFNVQITLEDKGKALRRSFIHDDVEGSKSLASIENCLAFYFKSEEVEWHCGNCAKVSEEAGTGPMECSASRSITYEKSNCDEKSEKRIDMSIVQDSQNACTQPNRMNQIDLDIAYQVREDRNRQEDRKGHADKAVAISKLPPVLTVHLKRFERVKDNLVKVPGHVRFGENLDVGQFVDPRSEDKDHSSYHLRGVIEHIGNYLDIGHNVAYVRVSMVGSDSSLWFRASDLHIEKVSLEEALKCEAYILFYERMKS